MGYGKLFRWVLTIFDFVGEEMNKTILRIMRHRPNNLQMMESKSAVRNCFNGFVIITEYMQVRRNIL